jgi:ABC-type phosphate transport system permease subunit
MNGSPPLPPMAPLPRDQRNIDTDHLNLLSIFHFVVAGLALLGILFLFAHFEFMHYIFTNPEVWQNQKGGPPPQQIFSVLIVFYIIGGIFFVVSAILNVLSGLFLHARRNRTFSLVVAGINCLQMPFGTVLGVFTTIVLLRPSVRELYGGLG